MHSATVTCSEFDKPFVEPLNIQKPVAPLLEVGKEEDSSPSCFEHVTPISAAFEDYFLIFLTT